ncbi:unnamed protein product [Blepharisma stoltei]|uniref:non-specific serine/threonine protein kinase n=1 Tax=Blepharisma stoltei TaxID=1481888 RepID=A0AAU9KDM9_9CILI|nr:unnamed protein product [Blepharisma stoltei]
MKLILKIMGSCTSAATRKTAKKFVLNERELACEDKKILSAFTSQEMHLLACLFFDLSLRSEERCKIDKSTFLKYFSPNDMIGERLFETFSGNRKEKIDFEGFLKGISESFKIGEGLRTRQIFKILDSNHDDFLIENDLVPIFSHFLQSSDGIADSSAIGTKEVEDLDTAKELSDNATFEDSLVDRANILAAKAVTHYGSEGLMNFEQFKNFCKNHHTIDDVIFGKINSILNSLGITKNPYNRIVSESKIVSDRENTSKLHGLFFQKDQKSHSSSFSPCYNVLKGSLLYFFNNEKETLPKSIVFLEDCYIESMLNSSEKYKYGISISNSKKSYKEIDLWCSSSRQRDKWAEELEIAASTRKIHNFYTIQNKIGGGRFSEVFKVIEKSTGLEYAAKKVDKKKLSQLDESFLASEIEILKLSSHPKIIKYKETFDSKRYSWIITELIEGGQLLDLINKKRKFTDNEAKKVIKQLLEIVSHLHGLNIVHRDLKPENILVADEENLEIKLADFGIATRCEDGERLELVCGTFPYIAPEVINKEGYGKKADLWSVGIIAYLLLKGKLPFDSEDKEEIAKWILKEDASIVTTDNLLNATPQATEFISKLIAKNPAQRMDAEALHHSWLQSVLC